VINAKKQRSPLDERLIQALVTDLDTGFVDLFQTYRGAVFSLALRMSGHWADAEDLAAEAFLRAYRALSRFHRSRLLALQPRSWLLTITVNLFRNRHRDAARTPAPIEPATDPPDPPDPTSDVEQACLDRESNQALSAMLTVLPEDQRAAVVLRHVIGLPPPEIAKVLGRPLGTVKSDISRALSRLRTLYTTRPTLVPVPTLIEAHP
jgi:RNA polymerase sigma-70 factor (ECF subfamily)